MPEAQFGWIEVLLLLGSGQGVFLALVLMRGHRGNRGANLVLSVLLLLGAYTLLVFALSLSGYILRFPDLVGTGFPLVYLTGPLFYIYVRALVEGRLRLRLYDLLHLIPFLYILNRMMLLYQMPNSSKIGYIWSVYLIDNGFRAVAPGVVSIFLLHVAQMAGYFVICRWLIARQERRLREFTSDSAKLWQVRSLGTVTIAFGGYVLAFGVLFVYLAWARSYGLLVDSLWSLSQAVFVHAIGYIALTQPALFWGDDLPFSEAAAPVASMSVPADRSAWQSLVGGDSRYRNSGLAAEQAGYYYSRLLDLMESEKFHLESGLRLPTLAAALGVTPNQLSQIINQRARKSFYDFVNEYRIDHAKQMLLRGGKTTVLDIAMSVGFSSKATFNRVFKQYTGMTPTDFTRTAVSAREKQ
jgi:AraC-like DNA-binding protein